MFDLETGRPLEVRLDATMRDLVDRGCGAGGYRLEPVDADGRIIGGIIAITEIPRDAVPDAPEDSDVADGPDHYDRMLLTIERQSDTLCRAFEAMTNAFGPVRPLQMPIVVGEGGGEGGMKADQIAQTVATVAKTVVDAWKGNGGGGGGAT